MTLTKFTRPVLYSLVSILALLILLTIYVTNLSATSVFAAQVSWSKSNYKNLPNYFITGKNQNHIEMISSSEISNESGIDYNKSVILYLHGNAGRLDNVINSFTEKSNIYFVSPAYPGYHESEGSPSVDNVYQTAVDTYDWLVNTKKIPENKIIILGHSLGGSPATYLASQKPKANKLVLINTFSSVQSMCSRQASFLCAFTGAIFNTAKNAENVTIAVRQFGYVGDTTIPPEEGKKLFEYFVSSKDKEFIELKEFTHSVVDFSTVYKKLGL
jgi:pimeloyl-ACP methyl ester carboxylesterase